MHQPLVPHGPWRILAVTAWLCGLWALTGCRTTAEPPQRQPIASLVAAAQQELQALDTIVASGPSVGHELGALNGKLQSRGYFRRVPAQAALEALESQLRRVATAKVLTVNEMRFEPPATVVSEPVRLQAGQRWQPQLDQLRAVVPLRIGLQGAAKDIEAFIAALPIACDRLLVVTASEPRPGGVLLTAEAYYERQVPQPEVTLTWASAEERLRSAGWEPTDPQLKGDTAVEALRQTVAQGPPNLAEARRILTITADFPRWLLRWQFFEERSKAVLAVPAAALASPPPQGLRTSTK